MPGQVKNVLIVKLGAIGDVVMALAVAEAIKKESAVCRTTWLIGSRAAPLIENQPSVDGQLVIDETIFWKKRILSLVALLWRIRGQHFDRVYILHWSRLFHIFFWIAGIPERHGFARSGKSFRLTRGVPYAEGTHAALQINQYLSVVSDFYVQDHNIRLTPRLRIEPAIESAALEKVRAAVSGTSWIAIAPGGGNNPKAQMPERRWPLSSFVALARALMKETADTILILGDPSERSLFAAAEIEFPRRLLNLAGELTLKETAAVIRHSRLFIGNDSGLLHIAGSLGTPHLSFFGPTAPIDKVPAWTPHRVLYRAEPCSPCYRFGQAPPCPYGLKCLTRISVAEAWTAVAALLKERAA